MKNGLLALTSALCIATTLPTSAALIDLGNGLVDDTSQNITWLQDANLVKTSCDANNALWQAFDPLALDPAQRSGNTKQEICVGVGGREGGRLNWFEAEAWIAVLNAQNYLGYNDWRQPITNQPDATCSDTDSNGQGYNYRCTGSELGYIFNSAAPDGLGNPNDLDNNCYPGSGGPYCLQNNGPFTNMQSFAYWSGTEYAPDPSYAAWLFSTNYGIQGGYYKDNYDSYVWAVRSGQSAAAPTQPVPALGGLGLGLLGLLLAA
ncbi:MAG: DUF1566 domain-containing protein, partial [Cellvibrionaceae bacterium]|nr:DUF1566 domain-containing protein [Cellvibrionaceae bacterium]